LSFSGTGVTGGSPAQLKMLDTFSLKQQRQAILSVSAVQVRLFAGKTGNLRFHDLSAPGVMG
jgi:hypothetical protein